MSIIFDFPFVSLNEYIDAEREDKYKASNIKKKQTRNVCLIARSKKFVLPSNTVFDVHFTWFKPNNRKDHDNICFAKKFILDGVVEAQSIKNDNPKFIGDFSDKFRVDKSKNYVWVKVDFIPH